MFCHIQGIELRNPAITVSANLELFYSLGASPAASLFVLAPISPHPRYSHKTFLLLTPNSSPIARKKLGVSLSLEEKI
jgi:hypothetical protein